MNASFKTKLDVARWLIRSTKTVGRWVKKGLLPPPLKLKGNDKNVFWTPEAIEKWTTSDYTKKVADYTKKVDHLMRHGTV